MMATLFTASFASEGEWSDSANTENGQKPKLWPQRALVTSVSSILLLKCILKLSCYME